MYLAVHLQAEDEVFVASRETNSRVPQEVAEQLFDDLGDWPDRILLIGSGDPPEVLADWETGDEFIERA